MKAPKQQPTKLYLVTVRELHYRSAYIQASSPTHARTEAESQDWSKWAFDDSKFEGVSEIVDIDEVFSA